MFGIDYNLKRITGYIIITCYLAILGMDMFHYHTTDLCPCHHKFSNSEKSNSHLLFNGENYYCSVFAAFNKIASSGFDYYKPIKTYTVLSGLLQLNCNEEKQLQIIFYNYSLRAPPGFSA